MNQFILDLAAEYRLNVGHALPQKVLMTKYIKMNPKEQASLQPALDDLTQQGFFDDKGCLTQKGFDKIYPHSNSQYEQKMQKFILNLAAEYRLNVGHVLPQKVLTTKYIKMNPKEQAALQPALDDLTQQGFFDDKGCLTQKGFDEIY